MQRLRQILMATVVLSAVVVPALVAVPARAQENHNDRGCGVDTVFIECKGVRKDSKEIEESGVWFLLKEAIKLLSIGVGILAVGGVVYGSILWASASGNPEQVKKARATITNVVFGVLLFAMMYLILNFVVPGGVFS